MNTTKKGLTCSIFKPKGGSASNGGISSQCDEVTLIDIGCELSEPTPDSPAVRLVYGTSPRYVCVVPVDQPADKIGPMFGGTFIYTSDSRFPAPYPIPLHDRWETQEENDLLSR